MSPGTGVGISAPHLGSHLGAISQEAVACLEAGSALVTFPEGTRSKVRDNLDESAESTTFVWFTIIIQLMHCLRARRMAD